MAKVSVIIPVYKAEKFIKDCAISLFEQTIKDIEYIFVNDCTPDNSIQILEEIIKQYPHRLNQIKIINHTKNSGLSIARNTGLSHATGEYVIACDSDDWVEYNMYELMYNYAIDKNADIVCSNIYINYPDHISKWEYTLADQTAKHNSIFLCKVGGIYSSLVNKLIKRELFEKFKIYSIPGVNMWEDTALTFRLRCLANNIVILNQCFYHYRVAQNNNSICVSSSFERILQDKIKCAKEIESYFQSRGEYEYFRIPIDYLKFQSKITLITKGDNKDRKRWKTIFPECHKSIFKFQGVSWKKKLCFYLCTTKLSGLAYYLFKLEEYLYKIKTNNS